jgi:Predicted helicase
MIELDRSGLIKRYLTEVSEQFNSGQAKEHAYRPALQRLMSSFDDIVVINDPKRSENGAPDFVFQKKSNPRILKGYAEAKDLNGDLDKEEKTNQMQRYRGYSNLILTNYLEFRFFRNGEKYRTISIGKLKDGKLITTPEEGDNLVRELEAFLAQTPESITSGLRLAQIMGGRARRLRDNIIEYLKNDTDKNKELLRIYQMMKELLVHDLEPDKFADMYAQTLVYGLFVARYNDSITQTFSRSEARDLVPKSNPFLLQFFDHIVGPNFDTRLAYIVDELCEIFRVSNVQEIVHKHLRVQEESVDERDPIIHFYEDFLQAYDPNERKKMGAYYTPVPVVRYIIRQVDRILKEDFGIAKGIASNEMITQTVSAQPYRRPGDRKDRTTTEVSVPRVQILDPALGTGTFLNETIKFIYQGFKDQEGRWSAYVNGNLIKRLFGFELMMAPYTIAHMKLGMTLKETGVEQLTDRLGVYLTNTLEEGIPLQPDLFSFGLAAAVSEESRLAAQVKSEHPVMVVIGNPPYSVSSSNKSDFIEDLVADYKANLNERNIQPLSDDYIKFIRFAEYMIAKNGSGILAMITNNSYIDGLIHRQMRKHLRETFDRILVLDLHGSLKRREVTPDGNKDENIFDIQQGVAILIAVKTTQNQNEFAKISHSDIFGTRETKFHKLDEDLPIFSDVTTTAPDHFFIQKDPVVQSEYSEHVSLRDLFKIGDEGVKTHRDRFVIAESPSELISRLARLRDGDSKIIDGFKLRDTEGFSISKAQVALNELDLQTIIRPILYRPFDNQFFVNHEAIIDRPRRRTMVHLQNHLNIALVVGRQGQAVDGDSWNIVFVTDSSSDVNIFRRGGGTVFPLYLYGEDDVQSLNYSSNELAYLMKNLKPNPTPDNIFDYIYAILHSPSYREKYLEFLKFDFPRIPIPTQDDFDRLVPLGTQLRELHLMKSPIIDEYETTFPVAGDCKVEKIKYDANKVWINKTQYFGNVPELAWNFYIGGYQPAQKWLKDRKGRQLSDSDLVHYQRIIKILLETDRIMKLIG